MKKSVAALILFTCQISMAQITISYYPFQSVLALSSNTEKLMFGDYRVETNTFATNLNMDLALMFNLKRTETVNWFLGAGFSFNPVYSAYYQLVGINGYFLPVGVRVKPFEKNRHVQVVFELAPYVSSDFNNGNLRTRLGLAYNFRWPHKKETDKDKKT
jgi:hypothetical protein